MKKKIILFLIVLCVATIITSPNFVAAHGMDGYCTLSNGYQETINHYLLDGRLFSAILLLFWQCVHFPFDSISFASAFFANVFLSLAIATIFLKYENRVKSHLGKVALFFITFTIFYMPLMTEVIAFDEAMIMALGAFLITLSAININKFTNKNYILSLLFAILGVLCYQGMVCFLIPLVILFGILEFKNYNKEEVLLFIKKIVLALIAYGIAYIFDYIFMNVMSSIIGVSSEKLGDINLVKNISLIVSDFIPNSFRYLFGFINPTIYYFIFTLILIVLGLWIYKSKHRIGNVLLVLIIVLSVIITPFIPNLIMGESNYVAARTALVITALPSLLMFIVCLNEFNYSKYIVLILAFIMFVIYGLFIFKNFKIDLERYKQDTKYINEVYKYIKYYENDNKVKVKYIYYAYDTDSSYYYPNGYNNGLNVRVTSEKWGMDCGFDAFNSNSNEVVLKPMNKKKYNELYKGKNYNELIPKKQLKFEDDKLYLLIY